MYSELNFFCCLPYLNVSTELLLIYIYKATENNGVALPLNKLNNNMDKNIDGRWIRDCVNPFILREYSPDESHHFLPRKTLQGTTTDKEIMQTDTAPGRYFSPLSSLWNGNETAMNFRRFRNLQFENFF